MPKKAKEPAELSPGCKAALMSAGIIANIQAKNAESGLDVDLSALTRAEETTVTNSCGPEIAQKDFEYQKSVINARRKSPQHSAE